MGERRNSRFQRSFNPSLKVDFQESQVTSDGGLILARPLDERFGFGEFTEEAFSADAAFTQLDDYKALEQRGVKYAIRIPANDALLSVRTAAGERTRSFRSAICC